MTDSHAKGKVRKVFPTLIALISITTPTTMYGWGNQGHQIIATLASKLLTTQARANVNQILSAHGETIEGVATWADDIRGSEPGKRPETPNWHFVDITLGNTFDETRDCGETPNDSRSISALVMFQDVLTDRKKGYYSRDFNRYEALKFIIHFTADIHQPLHCVTDNDNGGNSKNVIWFDTEGPNLHGVWDYEILSKNMILTGHNTISGYADFLFERLTPDEIQYSKSSGSASPSVISRNELKRWVKKANEIANRAYSDIGAPINGKYKLRQAYYDSHRQDVEYQIRKAGVGLARILNENLR